MTIVIARYNEDLDWVREVKQPCIIYNKGEKIDVDCIEVENVGREGDTWLRFIIDNYYELPEVVCFLQGNPFEHFAYTVAFVNNFMKCKRFIILGEIAVDDKNWKHKTEDDGATLGEMYEKIFNKKKETFHFSAGAQFVVNKKMIKNKSLEWWKNIYKIYHVTEHNAWVFERLWVDIWKHKEVMYE